MTNCPIHPATALISYCPKCRASAGGKKRTELHRSELKEWGKKGAKVKASKRLPAPNADSS